MTGIASPSSAIPIALDADPADVGFDTERLQRISTHFQGYIDAGRLTGWQIVVNRKGQTVFAATAGFRDRDAEVPFASDTIVRLFSMTKPITSVAAMMLYEQGAFELKDPVSRFIPSFRDAGVFRGGSALNPVTEPVMEPMRIWHLLTHTSGLTYGFHRQHVTDAIYRRRGYDFDAPPDTDLEQCCEAWAEMPLAFQPGREWNYGVSTDVLGRVIEVVSGQPLDEFFTERIFEPLGMVDTGFSVEGSSIDRVARLYSPHPVTGEAFLSPLENAPTARPSFLSGGGGLWGTAADYLRFCRFLLGRGALDGVRLLGPRTVDYMTSNHVPDGQDLESFGRPLFAETAYDGVGFGLGFSVVIDPVKAKVLSSAGEFAWGGAASTAFWCDPAEELTVVFLTQLLPSSTYPIRSQLKQLVYQALVD